MITVNLPRYGLENETIRVEEVEYSITPTRIIAKIRFVKKKNLPEFLSRIVDKIQQLQQYITQSGVVESDVDLSDTVSSSDSETISDNSPPYYWGGDGDSGAYVDFCIVEDDDVYG